MEAERVTASTTIEAAPEPVFAVLADPSAHADVDGTGWVRGSLDGDVPAVISGRPPAMDQLEPVNSVHEQFFQRSR